MPVIGELVRESEFTVVVADGDKAYGNNTVHYAVNEKEDQTLLLAVQFQQGHPATEGVNGVQMEDLLAICAHRLEAFQQGPYACNHNKVALENIQAALAALEARSAERQQRGVAGTYLK